MDRCGRVTSKDVTLVRPGIYMLPLFEVRRGFKEMSLREAMLDKTCQTI